MTVTAPSTPRPTSPAPEAAPFGYMRHREYYFDDGNVTFLTDGILFNVHRYWFKRDSPAFRAMFSMPPPHGEVAEGCSDDNPIRLAVSAVDFERFLWILYPPVIGTLKPASLDEWTSVLSLASMWECENIRALAIREMEGLCGPVQKISLARRFDISAWLLPAYAALTTRAAPLCVEEGEMLGVETTIRLAQARERYRADWCPGCNRRAFAQKSQGYDPTQIVLSVFGLTPHPSSTIVSPASTIISVLN
ncbi:hypothetical protein EXIGLDRAFT_725480 [Exidia glandulosa HHB12029]|uniref:Uncharacterized protein n=1 Tax=Exidia glandulosa HHB12029 TaxID=1314781 RepID=A0A165E1B0_EXIGL|nr:hypothetical protein EXIGLDRAFT_725480 [Exidia glandulosa HHB12029]